MRTPITCRTRAPRRVRWRVRWRRLALRLHHTLTATRAAAPAGGLPDLELMADFIHAVVHHDHDRADRLQQEMQTRHWRGWQPYLGAVFYTTLQLWRHRFHGNAPVADLAAAVARGGPREFDTAAAEALITAFVHAAPAAAAGIAAYTRLVVQLATVRHLLQTPPATDADLTAVLHEADAMTRRFFAENPTD